MRDRWRVRRAHGRGRASLCVSATVTANAIGTEAGKGGDRRHLHRGGGRGPGRGIATANGKGIATVNAIAIAIGTSETDATGTTEETTAIATTATDAGTRPSGGDRLTAATIRRRGDGRQTAEETGGRAHHRLFRRTGHLTGGTLQTATAIG